MHGAWDRVGGQGIGYVVGARLVGSTWGMAGGQWMGQAVVSGHGWWAVHRARGWACSKGNAWGMSGGQCLGVG